MGEVPPFITDVPEESIAKRRILDEPVRIFIKFSATIDGGTLSGTLYSVPKGYTLEISSLVLSAVNISGYETFQIGVTDPLEDLLTFYLDSAEHQTLTIPYQKLSLLIGEMRDLRIIKSTNVMNSIFTISGTGFLIQKDELATKTNIVV